MEVQSVPNIMMPSSSNIHNNNSRPLSVKTGGSAPFVISPENDPYPSWTFFPPTASYIPPTSSTDNISPISSPTASQVPSSPPTPRHSSPPLAPNTINTYRNQTNFNNNNNNNNVNNNNNTPSTHHRILDHCFHLSIETRLKQAEAQYLASIQEQAVEQQLKGNEEHNNKTPMSALHQDDWRRRQRTLVDEAVVLGRKGSNVEAIVDGILKSHRSSVALQNLPRNLKHRLHLCQLTSMVFGRFDVASSTNNPAQGLNIYSTFYSPRHGASRAAIQHHLTNNPQGQKTRNLFANPIQSSPYCRRHHRKDCQRTCCTLAKLQRQQQLALEQKKKNNGSNNSFLNNINATATSTSTTANNNNVRNSEQKRVAGLVDAIPVFLKSSCISFRDIAKNMVEKGEIESTSQSRIPEGWYQLLLEMMTQAVIESYLCDGTSGVDTILDVFSYGDDHDETDAKESSNNSKDEETAANNNPQRQRQQSPSQEYQDEILFVSSPEFEAFKRSKEERLQEILTMRGSSMEQHLVKLAAKYPLIVFERQMTHYIARSQKLLEDPKLSRSAEEIGFLIPPATSAYADGSLSMPVSDDEDDDDMHYPRLEEIKEEEEDHVPKIIESAQQQQQQQQQQPERKRHEKMKLATITSSMDQDNEEHSEYNNNSFGGRSHANHLPSPPPSVAVSRSSTVSPLTTTVSMMEDELSITEAAQILMMSNKKHKYSEIKSEGQHQDLEEEREEKLGQPQRTVKKIKV